MCLIPPPESPKKKSACKSGALELASIGPFNFDKICNVVDVLRPYNPAKYKSIVTENDKIFFMINSKELHWMVVEVRLATRSLILYDMLDEITNSHKFLGFSNKIFDVILLALNAEFKNKLGQSFDNNQWETVICKAPALISKSEDNTLCLVLKIISNAARNHEMT